MALFLLQITNYLLPRKLNKLKDIEEKYYKLNGTKIGFFVINN